jgi:hypothetical protein
MRRKGRIKNKGISPSQRSFDLYTFVAGDAVRSDNPFPLKCNCGAVVTIMPPFQDEFVVCPTCERTIKMLVVDGDPGYVFGSDPKTSEPMLIPVQGSSEKALSLSPEEREKLLRDVKERFK